MKRIKLFEDYISEKREDVGKYNTVKKVVAKLGRRPSEQELAKFITDNYYDVTEVEKDEDDPRADDKIADLVAFYKFDIDDWEIAWEDAQNESVVTEARAPKTKEELISALDDAYSKLNKYNTKYYEISKAPGGGSWSSNSKEGKQALRYKKMANNQQSNIWKWTDKLRNLGFEYNTNESIVSEAVSRATKIYQIATPAPKAMLVDELEGLFGDDYRHIVTEFDDDEGYESVLVFNLTKKDIQRIQNEIGDVLIWEYSIRKGKEISESVVTEVVDLVHVYDEDGEMFGTGELVKTKGKKSLIRWDGSKEEWVDSKLVKVVESKESDALAKAIDKAMIKIDDSMSYEDFALAVGKILKEEYGSHLFGKFMEVLHKDLGI